MTLADLRGQILFKTDRGPLGATEIYRMNPDGSNQQPVPNADLYNQAERFESYNSDRTAFITVRGEGQVDLWLIYVDPGRGELRVTTDGAADYDPVWSPVDNRIAFVSERTGKGDIYLLNLDGSGARRLTLNEDDFDKHPTWSPDGRRIAYWSDKSFRHNQQIWTIDLETGEIISLSDNPFNDWDPVWVK